MYLLFVHVQVGMSQTDLLLRGVLSCSVFFLLVLFYACVFKSHSKLIILTAIATDVSDSFSFCGN